MKFGSTESISLVGLPTARHLRPQTSPASNANSDESLVRGDGNQNPVKWNGTAISVIALGCQW